MEVLMKKLFWITNLLVITAIVVTACSTSDIAAERQLIVEQLPVEESENTNGLIRQYFPKGTDFTEVSEEEIKVVQRKLNDRPRKALDFYKPDEVINNLVALKV